ncbi:DUF5362 domain-containing protein [Sebaldella termitidis]|uniref:DUF5362 domain-containing protein n=1 Tax=Sebaldella termitidis TaxID=826 RepID=UPI003EB904B9
MNEILEKKGEIIIAVDEALPKQLKFIGLVQQIMGVLTIISGAIMCLTIIGAAAGVPYIIGALNIFKSGGAFGDTSRNESGESLREAIAGLAKGMKLMLIGFVIWIVLYILLMVVIMIITVVAASQGY